MPIITLAASDGEKPWSERTVTTEMATEMQLRVLILIRTDFLFSSFLYLPAFCEPEDIVFIL